MTTHTCQMGRPGRKAVPVVLTGAVKRELEALAEDPGLASTFRTSRRAFRPI
jgi:hypothetical protein